MLSSCEVRDPVDVFHAQRCARDAASRAGFDRRAASELAIVASELASNILKYGVRGALSFVAVADANGAGLTLIAADRGPQFRDLAAAVQDGWDDRGPIDPLDMLQRKGIGGGLGAVLRLTHVFRVEPAPVGKQIFATRYLTPPRRAAPA